MWGGLPVYAEGTETENGDSHRGFLNEGHQFADVYTERPVHSQQLPREQNSLCLGSRLATQVQTKLCPMFC